MENPWKRIVLSDYERHMSLDSVRQIQVMNALMEEQFSKYPAETAMLLGIAGGNGLEHINPKKIKTLYGVDINREYLKACVERYPDLKDTLVCIQADLTAPKLELPRAGLVVANLLVEYIGYECFRRVLAAVQPDYVSCAIQLNTGSDFVSDSPYLYVFDGLEAVHRQMSETAMEEALSESGFHLVETKEYPLPNGKKLARLDFKGGRSC